MNLIDSSGLTDSTIPAPIYIKALHLSGYIVPEEARDEVLEWLRYPDQVEPGTTIFTGPGALAYWSACAPGVRVVAVPGEQTVSQDRRCDSLPVWFLHRRGVPLAESRALYAKPPTPKHSRWLVYQSALADVDAWQKTYSNVSPSPLEDLAWIGGEEPQDLGERYTVTLVVDGLSYAALGRELEQAARLDAVIGLDVETDEEENYESRLVGCGFAFAQPRHGVNSQGGGGRDSSRCYYLPLNGPLGEDAALALLRLHFRDRTCPRYIAHGGKFDAGILARTLWPEDPRTGLRRLGQRLAGDGLIAAYVMGAVDPENGRPMPKGLKPLTLRYYGVEMTTYGEMLGLSGATRSSEAPISDIGIYCSADAYWGVKVEEAVVEDLKRTPKLLQMYQKLELPTVPILAEMELLGLPLDYSLLQARRQEFTKKVEVLRAYLEQLAIEAGYKLKVEQHRCKLHDGKKVNYEGCLVCNDKGRIGVTVPFNPNSRLQVASVLQDHLGLPRFGSTPGGEVSNDESALLHLREFTGDSRAKDWITFKLAWSKANKIKGTYLDGLWERKRQDLWQGGGWYVHPTYNQDIVVTGRLSSKDPNAQNIPASQRDLFPITWDCDYSQLELRIFAFASKCSAMIRTFQEDGDIHATTMGTLFGIAPDQVKDYPVMRVKAKAFNFGATYGAGGETTQELITIQALRFPELEIPIPTLAECKELLKVFWRGYPEGWEWIQFIKDVNRERGYAETFYGRREYLPLARSYNSELRAQADRQGVNMTVQGTAGDLIKMAAYLLYDEAPKYQADVRAQVHDELLGCVGGNQANKQEWLEVVVRCMLLDQPLSPVPLKVEPRLAVNWKEAH